MIGRSSRLAWMYAAICSRTVGRNGGGMGFSPANPASVSTCACTLPPRWGAGAAQPPPGPASPGKNRTGRPLPLTFTLNAVGVNGGGGGAAGGAGLAHARRNASGSSRFMCEVCHGPGRSDTRAMGKVGWMVLAVCAGAPALANTWDEPWHEEVVRGADTFVEAEVISAEAGQPRVRARLLRNIAGTALPAEIDIEGFYLLRLTSRTG